MLMQNSAMYGSSTPFANSTFAPAVIPQAPSMFNQLIGGLSSMFGPDVGQLANMAGMFMAQNNMFGARSLMNMAPIGGTYDPYSFYSAQVRRAGMWGPQLQLPTSFYNPGDWNLVNNQINAYNNSIGGMNAFNSTVPGYTPLQALSPISGTTSGPDQLIAALQNSNRVIAGNVALGNVVNLFDSMSAQTLPSSIQQMISANDIAGLRKAITSNPSIEKAIKYTLNNRSKAANLMNQMEMFSQFRSNDPEIDGFISGAVNTVLDSIEGHSEMSFRQIAGGALNNIGSVSLARYTTPDQPFESAASHIMGNLVSGIKSGRYKSLSNYNYTGTGQLMDALSSNGLLSTGGVDVFGTLTREDVDKLGTSIGNQLEAMTDLIKISKRLKISVKELLGGMQGVYSGDVMGAASRAGGIGNLLNNFGVTTELGQMAGFDMRASLGAATTAASIMRSYGVNNTDSATSFVNSAYSLMLTSSTMQRPISLAQAMSAETQVFGAMMGDDDVKNRIRIRQLAKQNYISQADAQALLANKYVTNDMLGSRLSPEVNALAFSNNYVQDGISSPADYEQARLDALNSPTSGVVANVKALSNIRKDVNFATLLGLPPGTSEAEALYKLTSMDDAELTRVTGGDNDKRALLQRARNVMADSYHNPDGTITSYSAIIKDWQGTQAGTGPRVLATANARLRQQFGDKIKASKSQQIVSKFNAIKDAKVAQLVKDGYSKEQAEQLVAESNADSIDMFDVIETILTQENDTDRLATINELKKQAQDGLNNATTDFERNVHKQMLSQLETLSDQSPDSQKYKDAVKALAPVKEALENAKSTGETPQPSTNGTTGAGGAGDLKEIAKTLKDISEHLKTIKTTPVLLGAP